MVTLVGRVDSPQFLLLLNHDVGMSHIESVPNSLVFLECITATLFSKVFASSVKLGIHVAYSLLLLFLAITLLDQMSKFLSPVILFGSFPMLCFSPLFHSGYVSFNFLDCDDKIPVREL